MECRSRMGTVVDDRIPDDQRYDLTTFGGPGDEQPTQCLDAPDADGTWFYAANRQRFGCGRRVRLIDANRERCVVVEVADLGPHICVEAAGGQPAWDVSPLVSRHLFGVSQAGWSEHRQVVGAPVDSTNPLGPCDEHLEQDRGPSFIGGSCGSPDDCRHSGALCLSESEGWPGGHCTRSCSVACPGRGGPYPLAACVRMPDGEDRCLAHCDYTLFETGCRAGYSCRMAPHPDGVSENPVCAPDRCG